MEEYKKLNPKSKSSMYMGNIIVLVIFALAVFAILHFGWGFLTEHVPNEMLLWAAVGAMVALVAIYLLAWPIVFYNRYRYRIDDEKIDVRKGVVIIRRTMVPIERVHQVEVTRGPINNMFGLANVDVTTAGGVATIEYLELDEAEEIATLLNTLINKVVKGLRDADE